jgi:selenocysteine lyase/cysteine desulfurase
MDSGTVRVSFSAFNRPDEVDAFAHVLGQIFKTN